MFLLSRHLLLIAVADQGNVGGAARDYRALLGGGLGGSLRRAPRRFGLFGCKTGSVRATVVDPGDGGELRLLHADVFSNRRLTNLHLQPRRFGLQAGAFAPSLFECRRGIVRVSGTGQIPCRGAAAHAAAVVARDARVLHIALIVLVDFPCQPGAFGLLLGGGLCRGKLALLLLPLLFAGQQVLLLAPSLISDVVGRIGVAHDSLLHAGKKQQVGVSAWQFSRGDDARAGLLRESQQLATFATAFHEHDAAAGKGGVGHASRTSAASARNPPRADSPRADRLPRRRNPQSPRARVHR